MPMVVGNRDSAPKSGVNARTAAALSRTANSERARITSAGCRRSASATRALVSASAGAGGGGGRRKDREPSVAPPPGGRPPRPPRPPPRLGAVVLNSLHQDE